MDAKQSSGTRFQLRELVRMMTSDDSREMMISDARDIPQEAERSRKGKKKGRRLGVSRSGARSRRQ